MTQLEALHAFLKEFVSLQEMYGSRLADLKNKLPPSVYESDESILGHVLINIRNVISL